MQFDLTTMALWGLSIGFGVMGWFAREMWSAVQLLKTELAKLEVKISADYVRYDRLQDALGPVMEKLSKIEDALHRKVDR